jgi:hypothetical protein
MLNQDISGYVMHQCPQISFKWHVIALPNLWRKKDAKGKLQKLHASRIEEMGDNFGCWI